MKAIRYGLGEGGLAFFWDDRGMGTRLLCS